MYSAGTLRWWLSSEAWWRALWAQVPPEWLVSSGGWLGAELELLPRTSSWGLSMELLGRLVPWETGSRKEYSRSHSLTCSFLQPSAVSHLPVPQWSELVMTWPSPASQCMGTPQAVSTQRCPFLGSGGSPKYSLTIAGIGKSYTNLNTLNMIMWTLQLRMIIIILMFVSQMGRRGKSLILDVLNYDWGHASFYISLVA